MKTINPYKTTLNINTAYWMARIARDVYLSVSKEDPSPDEKTILNGLQQDDPRFIAATGQNRNSAQAALIEHADYLVLAFRGTDELADWLDNINAFAAAVLFGEVHRGFWNSLQDVWEPLYDKCKTLQKANPRPLFLTGHSLGGAMATAAAATLIHEDKPFTSVYTFGQPRALTRATARIFNMECKSRYFRFHNNNDLVTRVPARMMGYSHVGTYLYISEEKKINRDPGFWYKFLDYIDGAIAAAKEKGLDGIEDHDIDKYLAAIEKWEFED